MDFLSYKRLPSFFVFFLAIALVGISSEKPFSDFRRERGLRLAPPEGLEHFSVGFREVLADSFWIRVIQDFDYCDEPAGGKSCRGKGWVYQVIRAMADFSPHFRDGIYTGALMLTVVVNDIPGASHIFDRAVELFPKDWPVLYGASYQAMVEEKNKPKAARLLQAAAENGAPTWLYALATKMYVEGGEKAMAQSLYLSLKQSGLSEEILEQIRVRLK